MNDLVAESRVEAEAAIARMREACAEARRLHARAELLRHMRGTAARFAHLSPREAAVTVSREWMAAWGIEPARLPALAASFAGLSEAFCRDARQRDEAGLAAALAAFDASVAALGTSLADEMAHRSECAHGWWELVSPTPADLPGRRARDLPAPERGEPFWSAGAKARCG